MTHYAIITRSHNGWEPALWQPPFETKQEAEDYLIDVSGSGTEARIITVKGESLGDVRAACAKINR